MAGPKPASRKPKAENGKTEEPKNENRKTDPMLYVPIPFRPRRKTRPRAAAPPPVPPAAEVFVLAVTLAAEEPNGLDFYFSQPVTTDGAGAPQVWVEMPGFGNAFAIESAQMAQTVIRYLFESPDAAAGMPWHITGGAPANLDLHGRTMPVPQSGQVQ
jgi:hypothetical protein